MRIALLSATALTTSIAFMVPGAALAQATTDWTGFYASAGIGAGYSDGTVDILNYTTDGAPADEAYGSTEAGPMFGVGVGYNQQIGSFVLGIEADASLTDFKGSESSSSFDDPPNYFVQTRLDTLLTLRGRLGFATGNMLIYGTAGLAGGDASFTSSIDFADAAATGFTTGYVAGAGVEVALNEKMSIKTEGLVYKLSPLSAVSDEGKNDNTYNAENRPGGVVVRSGVNFKF